MAKLVVFIALFTLACGIEIPWPPPGSTTTTVSSTSTTSTTLPPQTPTPTPPPATPTPTPEPTPTSTPVLECYTGPWQLECKWPNSCDIVRDPPGCVVVEGVCLDWGAAARSAIQAVQPRMAPNGLLPVAQEVEYAKAVVEILNFDGWCGAAYPDQKVSRDEIAIWPSGEAKWKEHLDVCVAAGAPEGFCFVGPDVRGLVVRGWAR